MKKTSVEFSPAGTLMGRFGKFFDRHGKHSGYIRDTAQIKHGNPIAMLDWLEYQGK